MRVGLGVSLFTVVAGDTVPGDYTTHPNFTLRSLQLHLLLGCGWGEVVLFIGSVLATAGLQEASNSAVFCASFTRFVVASRLLGINSTNVQSSR